MKQIHFYIDEGMLEHLEALPGTLSQHIREALYQYLLKLSQQSVSSSKSEKGGKNG
jgi:hypothetical protein